MSAGEFLPPSAPAEDDRPEIPQPLLNPTYFGPATAYPAYVNTGPRAVSTEEEAAHAAAAARLPPAGPPPDDGPAFVLAPRDASARELYSAVREPGGARGDSGTDLYFPEDIAVPRGTDLDGGAVIVGLGVRARCYDWRSGKTFPYLLVPRSSIAKTPLSLANSVGLIDAGYLGELKVALRNHSAHEYVIKRGTSLFQLVRPGLEPAISGIVLPGHPLFAAGASVRGEGGFGSTNENGRQ